jgi:hypothetical protein
MHRQWNVAIVNVQGVGDYQTQTLSLPDGDRGTEKTVRLIQQLVEEGIKDPRIRRLATEILRAYNVPSHDEVGEVRAIVDWCTPRIGGRTSNLYFRKDMVGREMLQPAAAILKTRSGDCDCLNAIFIPSLLGSIGYHTKAVVIKSDANNPDLFSHVYSKVVLSDGTEIPIDVGRPDSRFGLAPSRYWDIREFDITPGASGGPVSGYLGYFPRPRPASGYRGFPFSGRGLRGLGQDTTDLDAILQSTPSIETGAAQIIAATNPNSAYISSNQPLPYTAPAGTISLTSGGGLIGVALVAIALMAIAMTGKR